MKLFNSSNTAIIEQFSEFLVNVANDDMLCNDYVTYCVLF